MRISYTGRQVDLTPAQLRKVEAAFVKIGKLLDGKEEREARVILSMERHLHNAEITLDYYDHRLVGVGSGPDTYTALNGAIEKFEKQAVKVRQRWRDLKRQPRQAPETMQVETVGNSEPETEPVDVQIFRVNHHERRKPMSLEEALLEMERGLDYLVYVDSETDRVSVLIRRRDGNLDLVET